jgi:hypothetical protein
VEFIMRWDWTPSIVPDSGDQNAYLEMDDLGRLGRIWPEADAEATDLETVITNLLIAALFANAHDAPAAQRLAAYYHRKLIRLAKPGFHGGGANSALEVPNAQSSAGSSGINGIRGNSPCRLVVHTLSPTSKGSASCHADCPNSSVGRERSSQALRRN